MAKSCSINCSLVTRQFDHNKGYTCLPVGAIESNISLTEIGSLVCYKTSTKGSRKIYHPHFSPSGSFRKTLDRLTQYRGNCLPTLNPVFRSRIYLQKNTSTFLGKMQPRVIFQPETASRPHEVFSESGG